MEFKVRLPEAAGVMVMELAHAARLRPAVFLRKVVEEALRAGRYPQAAPLSLAGAGPCGTAALSILAPLLSNLVQLDGQARRAGGPLAGEKFLAGLATWASQAREIAAALRAGRLDEDAAQLVVTQLSEPGRLVNELARRLNSGEVVPPQAWGEALAPLREAWLAIAAGVEAE